jgi:uncharacterized protein
MIGALTETQCRHVLLRESVGRIGCYASKKVYVVPVTFVLDGNFIYATSKEGLKIRMMRKNSDVCFQVDQIDNMSNWRSVILWGKYDELTTASSQNKAMSLLSDRFGSLHISDSVKPVFTSITNPLKQQRPILYRISIDEISGRFEKI